MSLMTSSLRFMALATPRTVRHNWWGARSPPRQKPVPPRCPPIWKTGIYCWNEKMSSRCPLKESVHPRLPPPPEILALVTPLPLRFHKPHRINLLDTIRSTWHLTPRLCTTVWLIHSTPRVQCTCMMAYLTWISSYLPRRNLAHNADCPKLCK